MRVSSIRHSAFVVSDLDRSLIFYQDILGLKLYRRYTEVGEFIDQLTDLKFVKLEWVKLIIPKGGLIELLKYHSHPDERNIFKYGAPSNKLGSSHVALTVHGLDGIYDDLIEAGFTTKSKVLIAPGNKAKILYAHDPDGAIIELIEDL